MPKFGLALNAQRNRHANHGKISAERTVQIIEIFFGANQDGGSRGLSLGLNSSGIAFRVAMVIGQKLVSDDLSGRVPQGRQEPLRVANAAEDESLCARQIERSI